MKIETLEERNRRNFREYSPLWFCRVFGHKFDEGYCQRCGIDIHFFMKPPPDPFTQITSI